VRKQLEFWREEVDDSNAGTVPAVEKGKSEVIVLGSLSIKMGIVYDLGNCGKLSLGECSSDCIG
jgi:hypothetical protein